MTGHALSVALPSDVVAITTDTVTQPFWEAARDGRLVAPQCGRCQTFRMPPTPFCPSCTSADIRWVELSGEATVFSYSVVHRFPGVGDILMVPAVLDLAGAPGARLVSPIVGVDPAEVSIGMTVLVDFVPISGGWKLPVFTPVRR